MSKIEAKVIADSKNEFGNRITTMIVTMPRFILAEFNTHRMFSRNSASSRAIPFEKMLKSVEENPFIPIAWMKDHSGMQGTEYLDVNHSGICVADWLKARDFAVKQAKQLSEVGCTKQLCNRLLEPFMYHTVICTSTEWENFFALRCPRYTNIDETKVFRSRKDMCKNIPTIPLQNPSELDWLSINKGQAEIHMMALAEAMWDAMNESMPKELKAGEWHIPFGDNIDYTKLGEATSSYYMENSKEVVDINKWLTKVATARCARVSYTVVGEEGKPANYENDIKLHDRLAASGHWSPMEHCARVMDDGYADINWVSGNFRGFIQYRKMFNNENITKDETKN